LDDRTKEECRVEHEDARRGCVEEISGQVDCEQQSQGPHTAHGAIVLRAALGRPRRCAITVRTINTDQARAPIASITPAAIRRGRSLMPITSAAPPRGSTQSPWCSRDRHAVMREAAQDAAQGRRQDRLVYRRNGLSGGHVVANPSLSSEGSTVRRVDVPVSRVASELAGLARERERCAVLDHHAELFPAGLDGNIARHTNLEVGAEADRHRRKASLVFRDGSFAHAAVHEDARLEGGDQCLERPNIDRYETLRETFPNRYDV
jgi:hypothetical protein